MKKSIVIGIDFSKKTLDVSFLNVSDLSLKYYKQFDNTEKGCLNMIKWVKAYHHNTQDWLVCGEHTGLYSMTSAFVFNDKNINFWLENPSQIKLSKGVSREKNDKIDAEQIALYAYRFMDKAKLFKFQNDTMLKLRNLIRFRDRLIKAKILLSAAAKELELINCIESDYLSLEGKDVTDNIDQKIKNVEKQLLSVINTDPKYKRMYELITSVTGVGMQTAIYLLVYTQGFTAFNNPRQLACYCGLVPFSKQSGTSLKSKAHVSHLANKNVKSLLHMCALNAVRYDPNIKSYYQRKVEEGKHKMNVLNNVRNKLIHIICSVVATDTPYNKNYMRNKIAA